MSAEEKKRGAVLLGVKIGIFAYALFVVTGVLAFFFVSQTELPSLALLENPKPELATQVISSDGEVIGEFYVKRRYYLPYDSIPPFFIKALIATEDRAFFDHWGIHLSRVIKAMIKNILAGHIREGASTITQQLARNLYFSHEVTIERKIKEALTALQIEKRYTKKEILELYVNSVYFGRGAYGLQVASQVYFGKPPQELTLSECAYLVALLKGPSIYDFQKNYDAAIARRNLVLQNMRTVGFITRAQYEQARKEPLRVQEGKRYMMTGGTDLAPQFVEMIRQLVETDSAIRGYDLYRDGLRIYTTLNARIQRYVNAAYQSHIRWLQENFDRRWDWDAFPKLKEAIIRKAIEESEQYQSAETGEEREQIRRKLRRNRRFIDSVLKRATQIQTGIIVIENATGAIRALVGSTDQGLIARYGLNRVTQIRRQPGSAFKPFVYLAALYNGLTPNTLVDASTFEYPLPNGDLWVLTGRKSDTGLVPLRIALKYSINSVAGRLITNYTTPEEVIQIARRMGIESPMDPVLSIALGSEEVSPFEITRAFMCFPNEGMYIEPYAITRIEDAHGNVLYNRNHTVDARSAIEPQYATEMIAMLEEVVNGGTASRIRQYFAYPACGKTGTTNDYADAWFIGSTPELTAGVWVGFDDRRITFGNDIGYGGVAAAPIWGMIMQKVYDDPLLPYTATKDFPRSILPLQQFQDSVQSIPTIEPSPSLLPTIEERKVHFPKMR